MNLAGCPDFHLSNVEVCIILVFRKSAGMVTRTEDLAGDGFVYR